jgi:zinc transport system permease protein
MLEIFQYSFMQRALVAGVVIGVVAPLIGTFLVAKRYSLITDSLSHVSLTGVALGIILRIYPVFTALVVTIIVALFIEKLRVSKKISGDTSLAIFLSAGLSTALILIGLSHGFNVNLLSYLFGSITTVTNSDLILILPLGFVVCALIYFLYKEFFYVSFDEEMARVSGVPVSLFNNLLMIIIAVTVSLSMRIVGVLLTSALMVIPVVSASSLSRSFKGTVILSLVFGLISVIAGLGLSYYLNLPAGAVIVMVSLFGLFLASILKR